METGRKEGNEERMSRASDWNESEEKGSTLDAASQSQSVNSMNRKEGDIKSTRGGRGNVLSQNDPDPIHSRDHFSSPLPLSLTLLQKTICPPPAYLFLFFQFFPKHLLKILTVSVPNMSIHKGQECDMPHVQYFSHFLIKVKGLFKKGKTHR